MTDAPAATPAPAAVDEGTGRSPDCVARLGASWQIRVKRVRALAPATMATAIVVPFAAVLDLTSPGRDVVTTTFEGANIGARGVGTGEAGHFFALAVSLVVCSFVLWVTARLAVVNAFGTDIDDWPVAAGPECWTRLRRKHDLYWYLWMPRLLAAVPFVVIAVPLFLSPEVSNLWPVIDLVIFGVLVVALVERRRRRRDHPYDEARAVMALRIVAGLGLVLLAVLVFAPVDAAQAVGSPAIGLLAVAFLVAMLASLYRLVKFPAETALSKRGDGTPVPSGKVRYLPLVLGLFILGVIASIWNDNHVVNGRRHAVSGPAADRQTLDAAVAEWYAKLPERADPDAKIPIVFVATAGGASRAAYWTGVVLAGLESATKGQFGPHVFAISSVSGGTLGAAAYLAERAEGTPYDQLAGRMKAVNGRDHLAPTIAALLFYDLLQRLVPWPLLPDRAEALERSFESSWPVPASSSRCFGGTAGNRFARPFLELWRCSVPGAWVPVLLANGTRAEDGRRIVTTNLALPSGYLRDALDFHQLYGVDVPLSVVVTNSARFPIVSPAGTLPARVGGEASRGHIIDGGYFENGGITSLSELAANVIPLAARAVGPGRLVPVFIEINNDDDGDPAARYQQTANGIHVNPQTAVAHAAGLDALLPLLGLYNSRSSRGTQEGLRVRDAWKRPPGPEETYLKGSYHLFQLCPLWRGDRAYTTQMNWTLSQATRDGLDTALTANGPDSGCGWKTEIAHITALMPPVAAPANSAGPRCRYSAASTASPIAPVPSVPPRSAVCSPASSAAATASTDQARSIILGARRPVLMEMTFIHTCAMSACWHSLRSEVH